MAGPATVRTVSNARARSRRRARGRPPRPLRRLREHPRRAPAGCPAGARRSGLRSARSPRGLSRRAGRAPGDFRRGPRRTGRCTTGARHLARLHGTAPVAPALRQRSARSARGRRRIRRSSRAPTTAIAPSSPAGPCPRGRTHRVEAVTITQWKMMRCPVRRDRGPGHRDAAAVLEQRQRLPGGGRRAGSGTSSS